MRREIENPFLTAGASVATGQIDELQVLDIKRLTHFHQDSKVPCRRHEGHLYFATQIVRFI